MASADSLLALLVVAKSSRGANLVYAFPPLPSAVPRTSVPIYPSIRRTAHDTGYSTPSEGVSSSSESEVGQEIDDKDAGESYLGFPNAVLASLLSPSRELCDQPFELVVDHLAFVGHPVWLGDEEVVRRNDVAEEDEEEQDEEDARGRSRQRSGSMVDSPGLDGAEASEDSAFRFPERTSSEPPSLNSRRESPTNPIKLPRTPSSTSTLHPFSSLASSQQSQNSIHGAGRLISFNFVCIIDTPPDSHLSSHLEGYYKDVVIPITANLKALERKDKWLGKEAAKLRKAREKFLDKGIGGFECLSSVISVSSLAAAFSQLFGALKAQQLANITLGTLPIQVLLRGEVPLEDENEDYINERNESGINLAAQGVSGDEHDSAEDHLRARSLSPEPEPYQRQPPPPLFSRMRRRPPVKFHPWETLLPLEDTEEMKENVEENTLLWRFLDICSPTLSFAEYETLLDIESEDAPLKDVVEHLVYWRKARVVDVVSLKGVYAIKADFDPHRLASLTRTFHSLFPTLPPLPVLLSQIPPTEPFVTLTTSLPLLRTAYFHALIWLLQHDILDKQRTFVRLVANEEIKKGALMKWGTSGGGGAGGAKAYDDLLSTSGSGRSESYASSDHSGEGGRRRSRQNSRIDLDDTRGMSIVGSALSNSPPVGAGGATMLSRSQRSMEGNNKLGGRKRTQTEVLRGLSGAGGTTVSSGSERLEPHAHAEKGPSVILEPGRPTALERRWIDEISREKEKSVVERFERIVRMLNGQHHLDEMRHRASLSRKDIRIVLSAFAEHLILFTHP